MSQWKKLFLYLAPLVLFSLVPILASAQDNMGMSNNQKMSVTGCLKQGTDPGGYYIMGADGKMYELMGKGLAAHVNHKVTVMGMQTMMSPAEEKKKADMEKMEAGSATVVDMKVSSVKMISASCP
ncbi:MAG: hypothetical protein ABSD98_04040 [Candidatus Korobacteraceae bacterium]